MTTNFPMTLDKLLSLCLPRLSGRTREKYNLYRQFVSASKMRERWHLAGDHSKPPADFAPTKEEVDAQIAQDKARPFSQWEVIQCRHAFLEWYRTQHLATISASNAPQSETELECLRNQPYGLARVAVESLPRQRRGIGSQNAPDARQRAFGGAARVQEPQKPAGSPDAVAVLPEEDRYEVEERAAIREFDGGLDRNGAERAAFSTYCRAKQGRNQSQRPPAISVPDLYVEFDRSGAVSRLFGRARPRPKQFSMSA